MIQPEDLERGCVQGGGGREHEARGRRKGNKEEGGGVRGRAARGEADLVLDTAGATVSPDGTVARAGDWRRRRGGNEIRVGSTETQKLSQACVCPNSQVQGTWTLGGPPEGNSAFAEKRGLGVRDGEQCH